VVKGINLRTKHMKPTQQRPKGALVRVELPIHVSKVSPMADGKPTRVRFAVKADGTKVRVAAKGGKELGSVSPSRKSTKAK
jgi:large subunit ribosomal protein L24